MSRKPYENLDLAAVASRWDAKAQDWDRELEDPCCHLNEDHAYKLFLDHLITIIKDRHAFCAVHGVVDAGCATGLVLSQVVSSFSWGLGVDISPEMIRVAEAKQIPRGHFLAGDCFNLSTICTNAGAVVSRGVLLSHYGPRHGQRLLQSARLCLVRGGFIFYDFLNQAGRFQFKHSPEDKSYFTHEEISAMALNAGFQSAKTLGEPRGRVGLLLAEQL
jgi:SAM-dependent methyltransferase